MVVSPWTTIERSAKIRIYRFLERSCSLTNNLDEFSFVLLASIESKEPEL